MKPTCDLFDDHGDALGVLPPALRHYGAKTAFHGPAVTVKTFEVNSRVKELANMPGEGRVMVVDGGGSLRRALCGDVIAAEAAASGWAGIGLLKKLTTLRPRLPINSSNSSCPPP